MSGWIALDSTSDQDDDACEAFRGSSATDLRAWLRRFGLGQSEAAFRENEIDERVLRSLIQAAQSPRECKLSRPVLKRLRLCIKRGMNAAQVSEPGEKQRTSKMPFSHESHTTALPVGLLRTTGPSQTSSVGVRSLGSRTLRW